MMDVMAVDDDSLKGIYTPVEVLNEETSEKSVTWIAGCLIYEMATLRPAYAIQGTDMFSALNEIMEGNLPSPISFNYSEVLRNTVDSCLRPEPDTRISLEELARIAKGKADEIQPTGSITAL